MYGNLLGTVQHSWLLLPSAFWSVKWVSFPGGCSKNLVARDPAGLALDKRGLLLPIGVLPE